MADKKWTQLSGTYTHLPPQGSNPDDMVIHLQIYGPYSANNIVLDDFSIQEMNGYSVTVRDTLNRVDLAKNVTGWTADFSQNEQRIFQLLPGAGLGASKWALYK